MVLVHLAEKNTALSFLFQKKMVSRFLFSALSFNLFFFLIKKKTTKQNKTIECERERDTEFHHLPRRKFLNKKLILIDAK